MRTTQGASVKATARQKPSTLNAPARAGLQAQRANRKSTKALASSTESGLVKIASPHAAPAAHHHHVPSRRATAQSATAAIMKNSVSGSERRNGSQTIVGQQKRP